VTDKLERACQLTSEAIDRLGEALNLVQESGFEIRQRVPIEHPLVLPMLELPMAPKPDPGHPHLIHGEFQSDKYPTTPRGKVPLSCKDPTAQDLLWRYAQRRRAVDAEFAADLELALRTAGYEPDPIEDNRNHRRALEIVQLADADRLSVLIVKDCLDAATDEGRIGEKARAAPPPIPMILHCPECGARHVDVGEFGTKVHHTHSCQECGLTWRPAVVPTVGVQFLPGFKNDEARKVAKVGDLVTVRP
jgi:hypothetical protein